MRINHNIAALNTYRQLTIGQSAVSKNMEKLSSGLRINRAGDDAAGLAISEKMRGQIRGLEMASKNAQDGISLIQTAEGALNETHAILQRMRELAVQAANDTNTATDRAELQKEVDQLSQELSRIGATTEFNTQKLLDGSFKGIFHIGANEGQNLSLQINDMRGFNLGVAGKVQVEVAGTIADNTTTTDADFADGTYTVDENFNLVDSTGKIVASSADGKTFTLAGTDDTLAFSDVVTKVTISGGNATGITEATNNGLQAGSYTYDDTAKALKDVNGKIVATTTDGKTFTSAEDGTTTVFSVSTALTDGASVEVGGIDISSQAAANAAITTINNAIEKVSAERAKLGAYQNRLEHTINNLGTSAENLTAAESRIRDVDYALAA
ncbi:flagellin [Parageobacillus thermantarcticus]|uniref:Flagellin n=1 Tax=Parageobacillus thermantarcticus TaxID=186116 RepID=A0A1I0SXX3_9BACL|nr:flagellin [Parageobacillus thermantarcticus]SFA44364.1 flagellin [Parageobacillus thermantarcticus]